MTYRIIIAASLALCSIVPLGGCELTDPYQRPGNWRPLGVNDANLAVMVSNKLELVQGTAPGESDGHLAAAAVDRLRRNRVKALPDSGVGPVTPIAVGGANANATAAGAE